MNKSNNMLLTMCAFAALVGNGSWGVSLLRTTKSSSENPEETKAYYASLSTQTTSKLGRGLNSTFGAIGRRFWGATGLTQSQQMMGFIISTILCHMTFDQDSYKISNENKNEFRNQILQQIILILKNFKTHFNRNKFTYTLDNYTDYNKLPIPTLLNGALQIIWAFAQDILQLEAQKDKENKPYITTSIENLTKISELDQAISQKIKSKNFKETRFIAKIDQSSNKPNKIYLIDDIALYISNNFDRYATSTATLLGELTESMIEAAKTLQQKIGAPQLEEAKVQSDSKDDERAELEKVADGTESSAQPQRQPEPASKASTS